MSTTVSLAAADAGAGPLEASLRRHGFEIAPPGAPADVVVVVGREFDHDELVERIRTLVSRLPRRPRVLRVGELTVDEECRTVSLGGRTLKLSHKEFALLALLASEPGRVFTRTELLREIWDWPPHTRTRTLDAHASRLRRKLRAFDRTTPWVDNEWGVGYRLVGAHPE
jgi:DNA-binding response OmpR family regulator